jgi:uncharacterized protein (TIGR03067 family)
MKCTLLSAVFFLLLGTAVADEAKPELTGTFQAVAVTREGKDEPASVVSAISLKINGDELIFSVKDKNFPAKFKVDPKAKPAAIDIAPSEGPEKGRTFLGIYRFEKDELQIAFAERGERPTQFKGEDGILLVRLKKTEKK